MSPRFAGTGEQVVVVESPVRTSDDRQVSQPRINGDRDGLQPLRSRRGETTALQVLAWLDEREAVGDNAVQRVAFHEVTSQSVRTPLATLRDPDMELV